MKCEKEDGASGSIPKFGAIFMSNIHTRKECFRRKLLGLPSAKANFVKQVKAGMVLFLFEYERRELYGVFRACSDGAMDIEPRAYGSSGKQFPAQVRFDPVWYCKPLSEREFQDAIKENYFSAKKFNFGLSEHQVRDLLYLFSSRKLENMAPQRQIHRHAGKAIGEDVRVIGEDRFDLRNKAGILFEEDGLVPGIDAKSFGNSYSDIRRPEDDSFLKRDGIENGSDVENSPRFDMFTKHTGASVGKRRRDDGRWSLVKDRMEYGCDVDSSCGEHIGIYRSGDWFSSGSGTMTEDRQFLVNDRVGAEHVDCNISPVLISEYRCNPLAEVNRATNDGRFPIGDAIGDTHTWHNDFRLAGLADHPENPAIRSRRETDHCRFYADGRVQNDSNEANYDEANTSAVNHVSPLCKVGRTSVNVESLVHHVDGCIKPSLPMEYLEDNLSPVKRRAEKCKILMSERPETPIECSVNLRDFVRRSNDCDAFLAGIARENEHNVNNGVRSIIPNVVPRFLLDRTRQADEGRFLNSYRVDTAYGSENCFVPHSSSYTDLCRSRARRSLSCSSKPISETERTLPSGLPILETDYSLGHEQHEVFSSHPHSVGQTSCDAKVVPYDPEVPDFHHKNSSSVGIDCSLRSLQNFPPNDSPARNHYAGPTERSSQCRMKEQYFGQILHVPSDGSRTKSCLSSSEYYGKMELEAAGHKIYKDPQFLDSDLIPFQRISDEQDLHPLIEFDKHAVGSQGRFDNNVPDHDPNRAFSIDDTLSLDKNKGQLHFCPPDEMLNGHKNIIYCQNAKVISTDTKRERTSVFARLTPASEGHAQESELCMSFDDCDMNATVDDVMNSVCKAVGHRTTKMRKLPIVRQDKVDKPRPKTKDKFHKEMERWGSTMVSRKTNNHDHYHQFEESSDEIAEETRVVEFRRRSENKAKQKGTEMKSSAETEEENETRSSIQKQDSGLAQGKRRKLVRPTFGEKDELNEGSNAKENTEIKRRRLVRPTLGEKEELNEGLDAKENTENRDELIRSCESDNNSAENVQPTDPSNSGNKVKDGKGAEHETKMEQAIHL